MPKLTKAERTDRVEWLRGRHNLHTGGFNVMVTNGVSDSSWVTVPAHVGERILTMLRTEIEKG